MRKVEGRRSKVEGPRIPTGWGSKALPADITRWTWPMVMERLRRGPALQIYALWLRNSFQEIKTLALQWPGGYVELQPHTSVLHTIGLLRGYGMTGEVSFSPNGRTVCHPAKPFYAAVDMEEARQNFIAARLAAMASNRPPERSRA